MSLVPITLTLAAKTKYLHRISGSGKIILLSQFFLQVFNLAAGHFDNLAAFNAN